MPIRKEIAYAEGQDPRSPLPKRELMPARERHPFTVERKEAFLVELAKHGRRATAAHAVGVSLSTVAQHLKIDPVFAEEAEFALELSADKVERVARHRALVGVEEPIIGGKNRDEVVATVRKPSDPLMLAMLKAKRRSEFGERLDVKATITGGVVIIPALAGAVQGAPIDAESWEASDGGLTQAKDPESIPEASFEQLPAEKSPSQNEETPR